MKRYFLPALLMLSISLLFVGCNDSSSPTEPSVPSSFSSNISGNWSGQAIMFGSTTNVTLLINQATSDTAAAVLPLTGTLSLNNGSPLAMTGTKEGNVWTVSGNNGATIATIHQTLTSATMSTGDFTLQIGANKGDVPLSLTKS